MIPETRWLLNTARLIGEAAGAIAALPENKELLSRLENWSVHDKVFEALQNTHTLPENDF